MDLITDVQEAITVNKEFQTIPTSTVCQENIAQYKVKPSQSALLDITARLKLYLNLKDSAWEDTTA